MSAPDDAQEVALLAERAAHARARLERNVAALAYKVSKENLEREARIAAQHVVERAKARVRHWKSETIALTLRNPLVITAALGVGVLLLTTMRRRNGRLLLSAAGVGITAVGLGLRARQRALPAPAPLPEHQDELEYGYQQPKPPLPAP